MNAYGTYTQQGGIVRATTRCLFQPASASGTGTYTLVDGTLDTPELRMGDGNSGAGSVFTQHGGVVTNVSSFTLGYGAAQPSFYNQYGGMFTVGTMKVGRNANSPSYYRITNGELRVANLWMATDANTAYGHVEVSGSGKIIANSIVFPYNNGYRTGEWTQVGGVVTSPAAISMANYNDSYGTYTLGGGFLCAPQFTMGAGARSSHTFTQSGGTLSIPLYLISDGSGRWAVQGGTATVGEVQMARTGPATCRWDIAGGSLNITKLYMGVSPAVGTETTIAQSGGNVAIGTFWMGHNVDGRHYYRQTGGTNTVSASFIAGRNARAVGEYHMTDGALIAPTIVLGDNGGTGLLHVVGTAPQVRAYAFSTAKRSGSQGILELTLDKDGLRPLEFTGDITVGDGVLTIGRTNNAIFTPSMVVTAMTFNSCYTQFAQTNFLNGVTCQVNYEPKAITLSNLRPLPAGTVIVIR